MSKKYEEIALDVVKAYLNVKSAHEKAKHNNSWLDYEYDFNNLDNFVNRVEQIADRLADNAKNRIVRYDEENLDKEITKLLSE